MKASVAIVVLCAVSACALTSPNRGDGEAEVREALMALEQASHQSWLEGDAAALDRVMAEGFHFVAMNGALETKEQIVGGAGEDRPRVLEVESLRVEPEKVILHDDTAVVVSLLHLEASVAGRRLPNRMRILSVFDQGEGEEWRVIARSITPIPVPPRP